MNDMPLDKSRALDGAEGAPNSPPDVQPQPAGSLPPTKDGESTSEEAGAELDAKSAPRPPQPRVSIAELLDARSQAELEELFGFWAISKGDRVPREIAEIKRSLRAFIAAANIPSVRPHRQFSLKRIFRCAVPPGTSPSKPATLGMPFNPKLHFRPYPCPFHPLTTLLGR